MSDLKELDKQTKNDILRGVESMRNENAPQNLIDDFVYDMVAESEERSL